jgi:YHS domain-containing protein
MIREDSLEVRPVTAHAGAAAERDGDLLQGGLMNENKDPVCGTSVERTDIMVQYGEDTVYFCSETCRRRFEAAPENFPLERHEPPYTVKGKAAAPKFGAAGSGGLEFEPGPERHTEEPRRPKR